MKAEKRVTVGLLAVIGFFGVRGIAQKKDESATDLIRYLTHQSDPLGVDRRVGIVECGANNSTDQEDRLAAAALVKLDASAVPAIEKALDSIEKFGNQSPFEFNRGWLLIAYAKIKGAAGFSRLRRFVGNPGMKDYEYFLDVSIAVSLGITSYVDGLGSDYGTGVYCRVREPRDSLDRLVLAWEKDDRESLEAGLGPKASAALRLLLKDHTWAQMRGELWDSTRAGAVAAMGYRFDTSGPWAQPAETLDDSLAIARISFVDTSKLSFNPQLETLFKDKSGRDCGMRRIQFLTTTAPPLHNLIAYTVDDPNLSDLLRDISACASGKVR